MSVRIEDLKPAAQAMAQKAIADMRHAGILFCVTSTLRTEKEQAALYAQGREPLDAVNTKRRWAGMPPLPATENTYTVTNCDGVKNKSRHQSGIALDVVPANKSGRPLWPAESDPRWLQIAWHMQAAGFRWGGDWNGDGRTRADGDKSETMVDYPHYEVVEV